MELCTGHEWKVIATVCGDGGEEGDHVPRPGCDEVGAHQSRPHHHRCVVADDVFQGMGVQRYHSYRRRPLVVLLVETFIQRWPVEKPDQGRLYIIQTLKFSGLTNNTNKILGIYVDVFL